jgi:hypothetical protein
LVHVSPEAYRALQNEAVRLDRHATNVCSDVLESALLALQYNDPDTLDDDHFLSQMDSHEVAEGVES